MTITTSKDELTALISKTGKWYNDRAEAVLKSLHPLDIEDVNKMKQAREQFERETPQPTWKDLL